MRGDARKVLSKRYEDLNIMMPLLDSLRVNETAIIKASIVMMIYNMVEGVFTALLQEVFDFLRGTSLDFESISMELKNTFLEYHSKRIGTDINKLDEFHKKRAIEVPEFCDFVKYIKLYSGNLDAREMRDISKKKFGVNVGYNKNDKDLLSVKNYRNKLAHGEKRYLDACNHSTKSEIESYKEHSYAFMNRVITAFEKVYV